MSRSTTTKPPRLRSGCCAARWAGSAPAASALNVSCLTTAPAISRTCGAIRALSCKFSTSGPAPTANQRQDRTIPPNHGQRMGLRPPLPQRTHLAISPADLAAYLQSPPATLRDRQGPAHHTADQPAWASTSPCLLLHGLDADRYLEIGIVQLELASGHVLGGETVQER